MSTPLPVRVATERAPRDRPQNVPFAITPAAVEGFAYYRVVVQHGATASTARATAAVVLWRGSATPDNAVDGETTRVGIADVDVR